MKQAVIRQVKSISMQCDKVGNVLLAKFSAHGASDVRIVIPASIVFWLLKHLPVNQDPTLRPPPAPSPIVQEDWNAPRAASVQCKEFPGALRMNFQAENMKQDLTVMLDRSNVELLRQILEAYRHDLIDLDAE